MFIRYTNITGPSTEQQTKTRSDDTATVLCSGLSYIQPVSTDKH